MNWTRGPIIGRGSFATVSIATALESNGKVFAVKSAELPHSESLQREQKILSKLSCPRIVAYEGYNITNENGKVFYNLFIEYARGGSLVNFMHNRGGCLDEKMIRIYTRAIVEAIEHIHAKGIVHCDIKGKNVLVTNEGAKLADFGCARRVEKNPTAAVAGTPLFMAPEVAREEEQGYPADIWALGCTVIEMATGQAPWKGVSDPVSALYRIGYTNDVPEIPKFLSKQGQDFLSKCLRRNPLERWSASELLNHSFLQEPLHHNSPNKEIEFSDTITPTSILDQGLIWSATEEFFTRNSNTMVCHNSPIERINEILSLDVPNWDCDDNWTTVRCIIGCKKEAEEFGLSWGHHHGQDLDLLFTTGSTVILGMEIFLITHHRFNLLFPRDSISSIKEIFHHGIILLIVSCNGESNYSCVISNSYVNVSGFASIIIIIIVIICSSPSFFP